MPLSVDFSRLEELDVFAASFNGFCGSIAFSCRSTVVAPKFCLCVSEKDA